MGQYTLFLDKNMATYSVGHIVLLAVGPPYTTFFSTIVTLQYVVYGTWEKSRTNGKDLFDLDL